MLRVAGHDDATPLTDNDELDARDRARTARIEHTDLVLEHAPHLAVGHPRAGAAWSAIQKVRRVADAARNDLVALETIVGAMIDRRSPVQRITVLLTLVATTCAEIVLGFPGIKYLVGSTGDVPLHEDWRALLGAVGVAALSLLVATQAARQIVLGQRALLQDPDLEYLTGPERTATPDLLALEHKDLVPPSPVDVHTLARGGQPDGQALDIEQAGEVVESGDAEDAESPPEALPGRYRHVLMDDRGRAFRLVVAGLLVTLGIGMWGAVGVFRSHVVSLRTDETPPARSILTPQQPSASAADATGTLETMMAIGPIIFFLAQVTAGVAIISVLAERRRHLARRVKAAERDERRTLEGRGRKARRRSAADVAREYEGRRSLVVRSRVRQGLRIDALEDRVRTWRSRDDRAA